MALIRRSVAATLATLALAGAAQPAQAYWSATGRGTGTVRTAGGVPRVVSLTLTAQGNHYNVNGAVGTASAFGASPFTVTVVLCKDNTTWPCPSASIVATDVIKVSAGSYTDTINPPAGSSFKNIKTYGVASQVQTSGWTDYSSVSGPVAPNA